VGADQLAGERVLSAAIAGTRSNLSPTNRSLFDREVAEFKAYQLDDMQRQYQASIDASLRDVEGAEQAAFVPDNFLKLTAETIQARKLRPVTSTSSYNAMNAQLERVYHGNIHRTIEDWQEELTDPGATNLRDDDKSYIKEYQEWARKAHSQWIKFRDSCADLASSLYRNQAGQFDPAVSMKVAVTKLRIAELRYNPIGPQSN
jgi:hypothetical protein